MGIVRGGDSEYEEHEPSFEEKSAKWQATLQPLLEEDPSVLKLSGKYISNDDVKIICDYEGLKMFGFLILRTIRSVTKRYPFFLNRKI